MTDSNGLRGAIVAAGLTIGKLAEIIGMSRYSLTMKIDNEREFKASEIDKIVVALKLPDRQLFFSK